MFFSIILQVKEWAFGIHMFMNTQTSLREARTAMTLQIHIINICRMWQPWKSWEWVLFHSASLILYWVRASQHCYVYGYRHMYPITITCESGFFERWHGHHAIWADTTFIILIPSLQLKKTTTGSNEAKEHSAICNDLFYNVMLW
jgi:hypothetical protein